MTDGRPAANDEDRLPWLEPYREPVLQRARATSASGSSSRGGFIALAGIVAVSGLTAGGYWLGSHQTDKIASAPVENVAPVTAAAVEPVQQQTASATQAATPEPAASNPQVRAQSAKARRTVRHASYRRGKIHSAGIETARIEQVKREQGEPEAPRVWPKLPSPGPAGQVIQLGAFSHPDRAYAAYRQRIARYPSLARMPRVIVPIVPRSSSSMLYVLRLGTTSRQQSNKVCRNLVRGGNHCVVIG